MISLKSVTYSVKHKNIINNISADFIPNKLHLIIGPNGAGKSTLIKILSKQLDPLQGSVYYENCDLKDCNYKELATKRAVLSQNTDVSFPITVLELVSLGRYPHFNNQLQKKDLDACKEAMNFFDILQFSDRNYNSLSGGEKQRVQFARILSQVWYPVKDSCRYLLVDEPLTFLDIKYQYDFMDKLRSLAKQPDMVIVGVIHDLHMASKFGDIIYLLKKGELVMQGAPQTVITNENISSAFEINKNFLEFNSELIRT
jgi:iron complex transport system ATP-binding protein